MSGAHRLSRLNFQCNMPGEKRKESLHQTQKKPRPKRNSHPLSYLQVISHAILSSPRKRATLAEIYSFIQVNYPGFTENRANWKNTVRHNLSLHACFQRTIDKAKCYWYIHPSFFADFSRGDFSRRKLEQDPPLRSEGMNSVQESQFCAPSTTSFCQICESTRHFFLPFRSLYYHRQSMSIPYWQHPYFARDHWTY